VTRVAVVGLGLIGGSAALAFGAAGFDRDPDVRARARSRGIAVADTLAEAVRGTGADIVVTAVPTAPTPGLLAEIAALAPEALLTDTASLKAPIVQAADRLPGGVRFVAGHPMAGSRREGVEAADAGLFRGRPWVLVSTARSTPADVAQLAELVRGIGARPVELAAEKHDRLMTWVSHLPHAVAASLARAAAPATRTELTSLAGPGFLDTTRIAGRRRELALELALADPEALAGAIDAVREELARLASALRAGDADAVGRLCDEAAAIRNALEKPNA
jgi:prephenate dehydrogenase